MKILFCYVTCRNEAEAEKIGEGLVKGKLAGCAVVMHHVKSFFAWNGSVQRTAEALLFLKAPLRNKRKIEAAIKKMHSYDIPCIIFLNAECTEDYGRWMENAVK